MLLGLTKSLKPAENIARFVFINSHKWNSNENYF